MRDCSRKGRIVVSRGLRNGNAKLSDAQVAELFALRESGLLQREIAERLAVSRAQVGLILSGARR
jgi:transcriptional regulator